MHITIVFHAVVILVHFVAVYLDVPADILEQLKRLTEGLDALTKWKEEVHCVVCVVNEDLHVNRLPSTPWQIVGQSTVSHCPSADCIVLDCISLQAFQCYFSPPKLNQKL